MFSTLWKTVADLVAPSSSGGGVRSYDPLGYEDEDVDSSRGHWHGEKMRNDAAAAADRETEEDWILDAATQKDLTAEQRMRLIYEDVKKLHAQVRLSNLRVHDTISTIETIKGDLRDEYREVMWMTAAHLYADIIVHNRKAGGAFAGCKIHISTLAGMPMRGVYKEHVIACADLVWATLFSSGYELFDEGGLVVSELPCLFSPDPSPLASPHPPPVSYSATRTLPKRLQMADPLPLATPLLIVHDTSPPDVDAALLDNGFKKIGATHNSSGGNNNNNNKQETSKDK